MLDPAPQLQVDQDLMGNQAVVDWSLLDDPNAFRLSGTPERRKPGPIDSTGILERVAREGTPNPLTQPAPGPAPSKSKLPSWLTPNGIGGTLGDWNIGVKPTMSTSDEYDDHQTRERALRKRQDEEAERRDPKPKK